MGKVHVGMGGISTPEAEEPGVPQAPPDGQVACPSSSGLTDRAKILGEIRIRLYSLEQCIATAKFALDQGNYDAAFDQFSTAEKHLALITADAQIVKG